jgi:hypothetical protein
MMNLTPDQAGKIFDLKEKIMRHRGSAQADDGCMRNWRPYGSREADQTAILASRRGERPERPDAREDDGLEAKKIAPDCPKDMGMGHSCWMGRGLYVHGAGCWTAASRLPAK